MANAAEHLCLLGRYVYIPWELPPSWICFRLPAKFGVHPDLLGRGFDLRCNPYYPGTIGRIWPG